MELGNGFVDCFQQGGGFCSLTHGDGHIGGFLSGGNHLQIGLRMLCHVVGVGDDGIQGGIHPALENHGQGFIQGVHAVAGGTVILRQIHVSRGDGIGGLLPLQILKGFDVLIVAPDNQSGADVGVGIGEIVLLGALRGDLHAVDHNVVPAGIHAREQAIPFSRNDFSLDSQLFGDGPGHLHVEAHQLIIFVHKGPGGPVPFQADDDGAPLLDFGEQILVGGSGQGQQRCQHQKGQQGG